MGSNNSNSSNNNSSSNSNSNNSSYVKGNLLTLLLSAIAVIIAVAAVIRISIEQAFMIWLSSFLLDASYTFHKRKYLQEYELNILVRRGKNIVLAFVKVVIVEFIMIVLLSLLLFLLTFEDNAVSAMFVFFAVIHVMAFARSYEFMKRIDK
ncbi:MAG: hypothetical protein QW416_08730 [Candidatus Nitrosocaldaceae archaeon]